jgi:hypothetical protein
MQYIGQIIFVLCILALTVSAKFQVGTEVCVEPGRNARSSPCESVVFVSIRNNNNSLTNTLIQGF